MYLQIYLCASAYNAFANILTPSLDILNMDFSIKKKKKLKKIFI